MSQKRIKRICLLTASAAFLVWLNAWMCYAAPSPNPPDTDEDAPIQFFAPNGSIREGDVITAESGVTIIRGPLTLTAQKVRYNTATKTAEVSGDVRLVSEQGVLTAENGTYDLKTEIAEVSGNVRFESGEDELAAESGIFDMRSQTGRIQSGRLFLKKNNFYISGDTFEKTGEFTYIVRNCRVTTCEGEKPDWSITGSEVKVTIEGYGTVKNAALRVKDFPVFYLPYLIFPAKTKRQSGLLPPSFVHSDYTGSEVELPLFWAISDRADATFYEHWLSKRGLMQGLEMRYVAANDSKGLVLFDLLHDRIHEKDMSDPNQLDLSPYPRTNTHRYWLRGKIDQDLPSDLQARLDLDYVSDQDYLKEFNSGLDRSHARTGLSEWIARPVEEMHSPTRRSALRLAHDGRDYSLQSLFAYHQRPENPDPDPTPQPLAGLSYALLPRPLFDGPLFGEFLGQYDSIDREDGLEGHRLHLAPRIAYALWLGPYLEWEPSLRLINNTQWIDEGDRQTRSAYHFQTRLATALERVYDLDGKEVTRLKHKFRPTLIYDFQGYDDQELSRPWYEPLDSEGRVNRLTLSLANFLDARYQNPEGSVFYNQWVFFELSQAYNISEARRDEDPSNPRRPFEPLKAFLLVTPFEYLDLSAEAYWNHYDKEFTKSDVAFNLFWKRAGNRKDIFHLDYLYDRDNDQNLNASLLLNLVAGFSMGTSWKYDLKAQDTIENAYWLDFTRQCWGVKLTASSTDGHETYLLMFRLSGLGDVGK